MTSRCAASTTSPGPTSSPPAHRRRSAQQGTRCPGRTPAAGTPRRAGPAGADPAAAPAPSSTAPRAAAPSSPGKPPQRLTKGVSVIVVAGEALIDLVPQGTGCPSPRCGRRSAADRTTRPSRWAVSARPPPSAPGCRMTPSARRCWAGCAKPAWTSRRCSAGRADDARRGLGGGGRLGRVLLLCGRDGGPAGSSVPAALPSGTRAVSFGTCSPGAGAGGERVRGAAARDGREGCVHGARPGTSGPG